ncbi:MULTISPECIES: LysM peptidoglycan-binding domain-containing protein [unclassified Endozoicomonas]|uniref:FimV/HubP-related protein n=1 Tax=unclassified Endozoicomonas TaxID=2644528 RepID=UPI003BB57C2D
MIKKLISTAIVSSVIGSASANPELGYMTIGTDQYQLLNATIAIDALPSELTNKKLKVKLGSITEFSRHNIEYDKQVSSLRFKVAKDSDGKPLIKVRSVREITTNKLKAVIKLTVGSQKIYGIYDFKLTPGNKQQVTLNLLNADHKPEQPITTAKARQPYTSVQPLPSETSITASDADVFTMSSGGHYRVKAGQSISGIAMELLPRYPEVANWRTLMNQLASLNPEAFINGDINKLRVNTRLQLPGTLQGNNQVSWASVKTSDTAKPSGKTNVAHSQHGQAPSTVSHSLNSTIIIKDLPEGLAGKDNLKVQLGSITDYYRQGIDYNQQVAGLQFDITANSNRETVLRARSTRNINARQLTAVVRFSAGRKKAYGIYEIRPGNNGRHIAFNLLDIKGGKKPQVVKNSAPAKTPDDTAKKQALAALSSKLKSYEQEPNHSSDQSFHQDTSPSKTSGDVAKTQALAALRKKLDGYRQARENRPSGTADNVLTGRINRNDAQPSSMAGQKTYRVAKGESLSSIAMKLSNAYPGSWREVMKGLVSSNPGAFIGGDINKLRVGTLLNLPDAGHPDRLDKAMPRGNLMAGQKTYRVAKGDTLSTIAMRLSKADRSSMGWRWVMKGLVRNNLDAFIGGDINKIPAGTLLNLPDARQNDHLYRVAAGDNVSTIAWRMKYKYPHPTGWRGVMQQIVYMNPGAFTDGNPNRLRANEILIMPDAGVVEIEAENQELAEQQPEIKRSNADNHRKRQELRQKLAEIAKKRAAAAQQSSAAQATDTKSSQPKKAHQALAKQERRFSPTSEQAEAQTTNTDIHRKPEKTHQTLAKLNRKMPSTFAEQPVQQKTETIYKVTASQSLAAIAHELIPDYPQFDSWYDLLQELAKLNPSLFVNNDIGAIKKGTVLQLPEKQSPKHTMDRTSTSSKPVERMKGEPLSVRQPEETTGNVTAPSYNKISNSLLSRTGKAPVYKVPEGYTISMVAIKLLPLYPDYDNWTSLMEDLYKLNPDAFINRDINKLRDNSQLKLPRKISS